jgi:molybdenum cofactor synthesis domain-containing protein
MISVAEAIQIVQEHTVYLGAERVLLSDAAGRVLAEDIVADTDLPPFNRAQMDGYAVRASDVQAVPVRLRIVGESAAGKGWHNELQEGQAVRIMTGAPVPHGADAVQQVELTHELRDGTVVEILESAEAGRSIVTQGAEIRKGETVLRAGVPINAAMVAVLASFGYAEVSVGLQPRIAIFATGTELVNVDETPGQDQIRDSNNYTIEAYGQLANASVERLPLAGDEPTTLARRINKAAKQSDIVVTSGGVSMGVYDYTKTALKKLGAELSFERVALKPGKPTVFGRLPNGTLFFGLPGNPVSVTVTFNLFVRTAIWAMQGRSEPMLKQETAVLATNIRGTKDRESYLPAQLFTNDDAQLVAFPLKWGGSSDFVAFAAATALIVVPAGVTNVQAESIVKIIRMSDTL